MNCIVCGLPVEDNHSHLMSGKFLTERAAQIKALEKEVKLIKQSDIYMVFVVFAVGCSAIGLAVGWLIWNK